MAERIGSDDEYNPLGEHVVEIPAHHHALPAAPRRSYVTIALAGFLALTGIGITVGLVADHARSARAEAAQREELRVGWQMLGTLAADDAARDSANRAAAPAPATATPPAAAPNVVVVNVPQSAPGSTPPVNAAANEAAQAPAPQSSVAAAPAGATAPQAPGAVPVPVPVVAGMTGMMGGTTGVMGGTGNAAQPAANGSVPSAGQPPLPAGATAASSPVQSLPTGSTPASSPVQSLAPGAPGTDLSPVTFPYSQMCGLTTCDTGSVCCNPSCGICAAPGATCSQQAC